MKISVTLPLRTVSESNMRQSWRRKAARAKEQRFLARMALAGFHLPPLPVIVTITRMGVRALDSDNLAGSAKAIRDGIADAYGVDDGSPLYTWVYDQKKSKDYGVSISIRSKCNKP